MPTAFRPRHLHERDEMRSYQVRASDWLVRLVTDPDWRAKLRRPTAGTANWTEMGLGKTITTLTALLRLKEGIWIDKVLVVGPKKVVKNTWPEEIESWTHTRGGRLRYSIVVGTEAQRLAALRQDSDLYLCNVENLAWLERVLIHYKLLKVTGENRVTPFDIVVIDESDLFKSTNSARFRVMRRIARIANFVITMTGTPATEGYHSLWSQFYLLDGGQRLFESESKYLGTYFVATGDAELKRWHPRSEAAKQAIRERIKDITFTLRAKEYLELPKVNRIMRYVDLEDGERATYDRMAKRSIIETTGGVVTAVNAGVLVQKLAQIANGQVYDEARNVHKVHTRKLDELHEIYREANGETLLVAYEYQHDRDLIAREFGAVRFDDKKETQDRWNDGKIRMMLIHPKSGGHGVNIQFGGHNLVRYGLSHSLALYLQLLKRLQRPGQHSSFVNEWFIFARNTVDDGIRECVDSKNYSHEALLDAMQKYVASFGK